MSEALLPLKALAAVVPHVRGKPVHYSTLYRWATRGLRSRAGQPIRLDARFIGGTLCSSLEAVRRLGDQKDDLLWRPQERVSRRETERLANQAKASRERLQAAGFLRPR